MIVGSFFDGDDDEQAAWKQHDVYGEALRIIVGTCNRLTWFARGVLHDSQHEDWGKEVSLDHRTLQGAHDLLAGAWRFKNDLRQRTLAFEPQISLDDVPRLWIQWLQDETECWVAAPWIVRWVQIILRNQNQPLGYKAEAELCVEILNRFSDIPWRADLRAGYEANLEKS